jgi:alpha-tubulin suppressor-like RCC1 family protein
MIIEAEMIDISVGGCFGMALNINGLIWTWGSNMNGELGLGDLDPRSKPTLIESVKRHKILKIVCGGQFSMAIGEIKTKEKKTPIQ